MALAQGFERRHVVVGDCGDVGFLRNRRLMMGKRGMRQTVKDHQGLASPGQMTRRQDGKGAHVRGQDRRECQDPRLEEIGEFLLQLTQHIEVEPGAGAGPVKGAGARNGFSGAF